MAFLDALVGIGQKKTEIGTYAPSTAGVYHQPYEQYAPTTTTSYSISPQYSYAVQIASPEASISTKKEDIISTQQKATPTLKATSEPATEAKFSGAGVTNTTLAIVAVAAIAAYAVLK